MLKRCCFCLNLYNGSLLIGATRLVHWLLILLGTIYLTVQIFSPNNGLLHYRGMSDILSNGHVLFFIMIYTSVGVALESILIHGIYKSKYRYFKLWYFMTTLSCVLGIGAAINFILGILEIQGFRPYVGDNFFYDALCVLVNIVFFFIPDYLLGPRLTPVMTAVTIIVHLLLPLFHGYSAYVVYSYLHTYVVDDRGYYHQGGGRGSRGPAASAPGLKVNGGEAALLDVDGNPTTSLENGQAKPKSGKICNNCAHAKLEAEYVASRSVTPMKGMHQAQQQQLHHHQQQLHHQHHTLAGHGHQQQQLQPHHHSHAHHHHHTYNPANPYETRI